MLVCDKYEVKILLLQKKPEWKYFIGSVISKFIAKLKSVSHGGTSLCQKLRFI